MCIRSASCNNTTLFYFFPLKSQKNCYFWPYKIKIMIQRIQTLYLLMAAAVSGGLIFVFELWRSPEGLEVFAVDLIYVFVIFLISAFFSILSIFVPKTLLMKILLLFTLIFSLNVSAVRRCDGPLMPWNPKTTILDIADEVKNFVLMPISWSWFKFNQLSYQTKVAAISRMGLPSLPSP